MSRLSIHLLLNDTDDPGICAQVAAAKPRLVKVASPDGGVRALQTLRRLLPDALLVGRLILGEDALAGLDPAHSDPALAARRWFGAVAAAVRAAPDVFWEGGYNEWGDWPALSWYAAFEAERQRLLAAEGLRACIGNFSAHARLWEPDPGNASMPQAKWRYFQPALDVAVTLGNVLGLHGYNSPALDSGDIEDWLLPYRPLVRAAGDHIPPVVLTEFGIDRIPGRNEFDGWRTVPGMTPEAYVAQLARADAEMARDPVLIGACVYLWTLQELPDYVQYNIAKPGRRETMAVIDGLLAHIAAHPSAPGTPTPTPPPGEGVPTTTPYRAVLTSSLNARLGPDDSSPFLATLPAGAEVTVLDDTARRARIEVTLLREFLRRK